MKLKVWDQLALGLLGLSGLMIGLFVWLFINPPLPPAPLPSAAKLAAALPFPSATPRPTFALPPPLIFPTLPPTWTPSITLPPKPTRTPRPTVTPTPTHTATPTRTPTATLPVEATVTGVVGHKQALPLSCEARSAADWAGYFEITLDEREFFSRLPLSDNPEKGFVGDPNGEWGKIPPDGYGVYAEPVAELLRAYGARAQAGRNLSWEEVRTEISAGRPVVVWVVGHVGDSTPVAYTASDGQTTIVARYEHTVILVGYTETRAIVIDGENRYTRSQEAFLRSWSVLGNMAILWRP